MSATATASSTANGPPAASKEMIGTYTLVRRLGVGGMGEVWLARQRGAAGFARDVAIKRLLPQAMEQQDVVAMFIEEAQITGRLRHPNVVNVVELGASESGELYLVLEHVDGTGLHKLLRDPATKPSVLGALAIGRDIALALHAAHTLTDDDGKDLGLVHRDVTPSNVMIDRSGHIKLMDFGIAKVRAKSNQTEAGIIKGKIAYLAPEQLRGSVDPRSDIFSLGLVLWEIVAGQQSRSGSSDAVMMAKVALDAVPSIATVCPDLPAPIIAAIDKACALDPDHRYQTGEEMAQAMLAAMDSLPGSGRMEGARDELAARVKAAVKRDGEAVAGSTNASRTVEGEKPLALTLHSLVVQDGDHTISRPLSPDMLKVIAPTDARTSSGTRAGGRTRTGGRKRSSAAFPIIAIAGALAVIGGAFILRGRSGATGAQAAGAGRTPTSANLVPEGTPPGGSTPAGSAVTPPPPPSNPAPVAVVTTDAGSPSGVSAVHSTDAGAATAVATAANPRANSPATAGTHTNRGTSGAAAAHAQAHYDDSAEPGHIGVVATPWAHVTIDGHDMGDTPVAPVSLRPGSHVVMLTNRERQITRRVPVQLAPGQRLIVREDLTRE